MPALNDFKWPRPGDASDQKFCADVVEYGCHIVTIPQDAEGPGYSFSIGLFLNFRHPDMVVFGLSHEIACILINDIREKIEQGGKFQAGEETSQFFTQAKVSFVPVNSNFYRDYFGCSLWFYRCLNDKFPMLQAVWADRQGKFPWETGHDPQAAKLQPILSQT